MCAAAFKDGKVDPHRSGIVFFTVIVQHLANVIGISQSNIAFARPDRLDLIAVPPQRLMRQVGL